MENRFIIFAVFATVVQSALASSSAVGGINASSDIQVAYGKTTEAWTRAIEVLFESIGDNLASDHARHEYYKLILSGFNYFFAVVPSSSRNDTLRRQFSSDLKTSTDTVRFAAVDLAKSKNGTYLDILNGIDAFHTKLNLQVSLKSIFEISGISSFALWTKVMTDVQMLYINVFAAMVSRAAVDFGFLNEIPSSFKDVAIAEVKAVSQDFYDFIQNEPNHFCVSDVISSIISNTSGTTPLKYFPRRFQQYIFGHCWRL